MLGADVHAQQFGGNPPSVRWNQLSTDTFRIVYPRGLDSVAARVGVIVNNLATNNYNALGTRVKKIDIVLQNQPINSNGYVGLGPYRSEFYLTPPADNFDQGSMHWADQLALHEYRHVEQYNNFKRGISKAMGVLFGQEGYAVAVNAAVPNWFFEGDAVYQETALSTQGRGRMPSFMRAYPALWRDGKEYSWMKLRNGSLKDYVPNHYNLGYLLVNYGYEKYGDAFWRKVTTDATKFKGLFYPMQKAVRRNAQISYMQFINDAFDYYKNKYKIEEHGNKLLKDSSRFLFPVNYKDLTSYYYPQQVSENETVYLKTSNKKRPGFYLLRNGREQLLKIRDISSERQFSYSNGRIVYAAVEADPRWSWKTHSVLKVLDTKSGLQKTVSKGTRYFSPDISADGKQIVANRVGLKGASSLVVLDARNGILQKEFSQKGLDYFANPKFKGNEIVTAVRREDGKTFVALINPELKTVAALTPPTHKVVGHTSVEGNKVYFVGADGLNDALFRVDINSKKIERLNNNQLAAYFINSGYGKINWSSFTADGMQLQQQPKNPDNWKEVTLNDFEKGASAIVANPAPISIDALVDSQYNHLPVPKKYAQLTRPVIFHSWRPNYDDPEYSFTLYGENVLNTVETQLYYLYNENERTNAVGGTLVYGGLYPFIGIGSKYTIDRAVQVQNKIKHWNQWDNYVSVSIPLNWNNGTQFRFFNVSSNLGYRSDFSTGINSRFFPSSGFGYFSHGIGYGQQIQRAPQDIFPQLGFSINTQYRYAINRWDSKQLFAKATIFLPGLFPTHSLVLSATLQEAFSTYQLFGNRLNFARGYNAVNASTLTTAAFNYHLPIWYPDWGFANIAYIQRIRGAAFYDYTSIGKKQALVNNMQSVGGEVYFDTQWWNQHPITFGFRSGLLLTKDPVTPGRKLFFEFILPVSIIPR